VQQLGARLYDPALGRFLSRDPLLIPRTAATTNPYAFAMNDPVNSADPSGLDNCPEGHCPQQLPPGTQSCLTAPWDCLKHLGNGADHVVNSAIDAIGDAASAVDDFFGGGKTPPKRIDPASARGLMGAVSSSSHGGTHGSLSVQENNADTQLSCGDDYCGGALLEAQSRGLEPLRRFMHVWQTDGLPCAFGPQSGVCAATIDSSHAFHKVYDRPEVQLALGMVLPVEAPTAAAVAAADEALAAGKVSGAASELRVGENSVTAVSGEIVPPNPDVTGALMGTPTVARAPWHGGCAEIACLDKALNMGLDVNGGRISTANIGISGAGHGTLKVACSSCAFVLRIFGVEF
jgi:hypothetical protein